MNDELKAAEIFRQIDDLLKPHGWPAQKLLRDYIELVKKILVPVPEAPLKRSECCQKTVSKRCEGCPYN